MIKRNYPFSIRQAHTHRHRLDSFFPIHFPFIIFKIQSKKSTAVNPLNQFVQFVLKLDLFTDWPLNRMRIELIWLVGQECKMFCFVLSPLSVCVCAPFPLIFQHSWPIFNDKTTSHCHFSSPNKQIQPLIWCDLPPVLEILKFAEKKKHFFSQNYHLAKW